MDGNPMIDVAVAAMRWHHARRRRIEAEHQYKEFVQEASYRPGCGRLSDELAESRRIEARYKRRLTQSCEKEGDKPPQHEIIEV